MTIHTAVNGLAVLTGRFLQNAGVTAMLRSGFAAIRLATLAINSPRSVRILRAMRPDVAKRSTKACTCDCPDWKKIPG